MTFNFQKDPFENLKLQLEEAKSLISVDPDAMSLATVSDSGVPSVRTVLFKGVVRDGLSFYTNYESQKSHEIAQNKSVALLFFWRELACQVRVEGLVQKMTRQESETYFKTRARISQIGAWASAQSQPLISFERLQERVQELEQKFANHEVPCPPFWGGYIVQPLKFEFWFGKTGRLHERYVYEREDLHQAQWQRSYRFP